LQVSVYILLPIYLNGLAQTHNKHNPAAHPYAPVKICFVLTGCLGAPGGFMIGLHLPLESGEARDWGSHRNARLFSLEELQPESYVVDLNQDSIFQFQAAKSAKFRLVPIKAQTLTKRLPVQSRRRLEQRLRHLAEEFHIK
jgi:hypothetical protein